MTAHASVSPPMAHPLPAVARAALLGLTLGLTFASFALVYAAFMQLNHVCEFPDTEECAFELSTASDLAQLQSFAALGCALVAGGMFLLLRRRS